MLKTNNNFISFVFACLVLAALFLTSCEKVISIDLKDSDKKYVVEAVVTDQDSTCKVLLSQTKNFSEDNSVNGISGAQITIADNEGSTVTILESSPGVYELPNFKGISGHAYYLTVHVNGEVFTAVSTMPSLVPLDSIYITEQTFFGDVNKYASVQYSDPFGKGNAYRYIQYVNGEKEQTIFVRDDDLTDGKLIKRELISFNNNDDDDDETKIKSGDTVRVDMLCIDYPMYTYWFSLSESSTGENQSATPANPVTNISGGALGYFSAHTLQSKTLVVP